MAAGTTFDHRLATALGFDAADLVANQQGRLTDRQRDRIDVERRKQRRFGSVGAVVILATVGAIVGYGLTQTGDVPGAQLAFAAFGGVVLLIVALSFLRAWVSTRHLRRGRLVTVDGIAQVRITRSWSPTLHAEVETYDLRVGRNRFRLANRAQIDAFVDGGRYVVHHIPNPGTPLIMSAAVA